MPSLQIKTLISDISKNCNNLYADTLRLVSFVKCIFLQIIVFEIVLFNTFWRLWNIILEIVIHSYNKHYFVQIHLLLCWQFKSPSRNMKLVLLQQHEDGRCWSGKCVVFLKCSFFFSSDKTSAVTFRALCIASEKLLLLPSLRKLLIIWLGLDVWILASH